MGKHNQIYFQLMTYHAVSIYKKQPYPTLSQETNINLQNTPKEGAPVDFFKNVTANILYHCLLIILTC